jgi:rhodanese-related sulfurtransferase
MSILVIAAGCSPGGNRDITVPSEDGPTASASVTEVSVAEAEALLEAEGELVVLDVRTPGEFAEGHIVGALNLDFRSADFEAGLDLLDKGVPYLLHCASGRRSVSALESMRQKGFQSVYHLTHGFRAWVRAGKPAER